MFSMEGYQSKSVLVNTHAKLPDELLELPAMSMDLTLLPSAKYEGADTDELDFPFALVRYDKKLMNFVQDQQYTTDMMRTNGAVLLQAGRATRK